MQDAEALFFIDHDQAEILENHIARDQAMRSDDDVHPAVAQLLEHLALLAVRPEPAQHFDSHRIIEHPLPERFEMLLGEHRRRGEHRDLFAIHHRLEGRANRDLGFAETNIAANQAIHRARLLHVALRVGDGFELIDRFPERERSVRTRPAISCPGRRRGRDASRVPPAGRAFCPRNRRSRRRRFFSRGTISRLPAN